MGADRAHILSVFEKRLRPREQHAESTLGEEIDALLGFAPGMPAAGYAGIGSAPRGGDWRSGDGSYGSHAERALQQLCTWCLKCLRSQYALPDALRDENVCVRVVVGRHVSPFTQRIGEYHYIVLSAGYLKSVENLFRTLDALAAIGEGAPIAGDRCIVSNEIGGASAERALVAESRKALAAVYDLFNDVIFWSAHEAPFSYPEALLTAMARMTYEVMIGGMYASEGKPDAELRAQSTPRSKTLTRLAAAYVLCHELAHIAIGDDAHAAGDPENTEKVCDRVATECLPLFVQDYRDAWSLHINGGIEHIAGLLGFFMAAEVMEKVSLIVGLKLLKFHEGDEAYARCATRIEALDERRGTQLRMLGKMLEGEHDMQTLLEQAQSEFTVLPIAIEMIGMRLLQNCRSRFADHFHRRFRTAQ